jgi:galactokinase
LTDREAFLARFGRKAEAEFFSPGRVNLIGEHTDYNGGLVLPLAIGLGTRLVVARRRDRSVRVHSESFDETVALTTEQLAAGPSGHWTDYLLGVLSAFPGGWPEPGLDLLVRADLPAGRGLSSSASLTLGFAGLLDAMFGTGLDRLQLARIAQQAENDFVGVACGLLDPFAIAMGREDHVVALDCGTLDWTWVPFPGQQFRILVADTGVSRSLAGSSYNTRREECHRARGLAGRDLVALEVNDFADGAPLCADPVALRRARHVVTEHARVRSAIESLKAGDLERLGALMNASHRSLADDYEVSCAELDAMAEVLQGMEGVAGAKMTGAGFGGAVVALVRRDRLETVRHALSAAYAARCGHHPDLLVCRPGPGFHRVDTD